VAEHGRNRGDVVGDAGVFIDIARDDAAGGKRPLQAAEKRHCLETRRRAGRVDFARRA
jgi:hypothetical protein